MINSKSKGSAFERSVCTQLSNWWSEGTNDSIFWRATSSGARSTQRAKQSKSTANSAGDISYLDESGKPLLDLITFELKSGYPYYELQRVIDRLPTSKISILEQWISQAKASQKQAGSKSWAIIAKKNLKKPLIYFPEALFQYLPFDEDEDQLAKVRQNNIDYLTLFLHDEGIVCMAFDDFLKLVDVPKLKLKLKAL